MFRPNGSVERGAMAAFFYCMSGLAAVHCAEHSGALRMCRVTTRSIRRLSGCVLAVLRPAGRMVAVLSECCGEP